MGIQVAFRQVVVGSVLHGLARALVITRLTQDNDQGIGSRLMHPIEHSDSGTVGQRQVEQDDLDVLLAQSLDGIGQSCHALDAERPPLRTGQRPLNEPGIFCVGLDKQNSRRGIAHDRRIAEQSCIVRG